MPIDVTFGTIAYKEGGLIEIPVSFSEQLIGLSKTCFFVAGDDLDGFIYELSRVGSEHRLFFVVPSGKKGQFSVTARGNVLTDDYRWESLMQTIIEVVYDTSVPKLLNYDIPANYTVGGIFDVILQYGVACTVADPRADFGDGATYHDFFIFDGAYLGVPNLYRKTDNVYPTLPLPDELPTEIWTQDDLQTEDATIYLLRWSEVLPATGIFNMTIKPGFVRGPVS